MNCNPSIIIKVFLTSNSEEKIHYTYIANETPRVGELIAYQYWDYKITKVRRWYSSLLDDHNNELIQHYSDLYAEKI